MIGFLPFITDIFFGLLPAVDSILFDLFEGAFWLIVGVIEVGLLSLSYRFLVGIENTNDVIESALENNAVKEE